MATTTLRQLITEHPEWADLPIVVYCPDGTYDWLGAAGRVYQAQTEDGYETTPVLVFAGN